MIEQLITESAGAIGWHMFITILFAIPTWIVVNGIKEWWLFKKGKDALIKDMILSKGALLKIGEAKGRFDYMDKRRIILEEEIDNNGTYIHYVPIRQAIESTITRLDPSSPASKRTKK